MNIIIDLVFVALIAVNILDGRRKGFIKIVLSFAAMLITWFIASELSLPVAEWANDAFAGNWITGSIETLIADGIANGSDALIASIPDYIANAAEIANISLESLAVQLGNTIDPAAAATEIYAAIENPLVLPVIRIISFFALYAVLNVVMSVLINIISKVFRLPVLKSFNRLLGAAVGGLRGAVIVAVISIVLGLVVMVIPETPLAEALDQSVIHGIVSEATHSIFAA